MIPEGIGAAALVLAVVAAAVAVVSRPLAPTLRAEERLAVALATSPVLLGWAVFLVALPAGFGTGSAVAGLALWVIPAAVLLVRRPKLRAELGREWRDLAARVRAGPRAAASVAVVLALCLAVATPLLLEVWVEQPDGRLTTGIANNLGDVVLHVGIAHGFVYGENLPPDNVIWSGRRLAYPFVPDFASAALMALGAGTGAALSAPQVLTLAGVALLLGCLAWRASGRLLAALLPAPLLLLGGGSQYLLAIAESLEAGAWRWPGAEALAARQIVWQSPLLSLLVPQRTTLAGLGLILSVVLLVFVATPPGSRASWRRLIFPGLLCGALPLVFAHGYLALAALLPLALVARRELWPGVLALGAAAALPALPQVGWLTAEMEGAGFVRWMPGWMAGSAGAPPGAVDVALFWLWNLGPLVPLGLLSLALARRLRLARPGFWAACWSAFLLPSLWAFAPWAWDNTKLYVVWLVLALVPVAALLAGLASRGAAGAAGAAILVAALVASGAHDVARALFAEQPYLEYTPVQRRAARRLRETTPPRAVVLEGPHWAQLARLSGRRSSIGYPGHLWSHGIDYLEREQEVVAFYRSLAPDSPAHPVQWRVFLEGLGVDVVVVGPRERTDYGADPARLAAALPQLFREGDIAAYAVAPLPGDARPR